ncbi:MAG TPA: cytochrome c [Pseudogracilibacillus sp.]|nr:cytochrome c [Pseudogracilibacillus sp.]
MKKWLVAVLLGVVLVLGACGGNNDNGNNNAGNDGNNNNNTTEASAGEELYKKQCASCHGQDLSGGAGPSLETVGADHSADDIVSIIEDGQGSMPAGLLSGDDAQEVADWLATHK